MVAAERQQERAGLEQLSGFALDRGRRLLVIARVEQAVAIIDHREPCEQVALERILRVVVHDRRGAADRLRAEARARPVGDRRIEGDTPDDRIRALHVLRIAAAHERQRPGIGRVAGGAGGFRGREGVVDGTGWHRVFPCSSGCIGAMRAWRNKKAGPKARFCICPIVPARQRLENWNERRALALPYFFRSTVRESRVRKPPFLSTVRKPGS